jgi:hypothetical protein
MGSRGEALVGGLGDFVPQKLSIFAYVQLKFRHLVMNQTAFNSQGCKWDIFARERYVWGASAPAYSQRPYWGWVREGSPLPPRGFGIATPEKFKKTASKFLYFGAFYSDLC